MVQQLHLIELDCGNGPQFTGEDSLTKYNRNLEQQPADWLWRTKPVHYTLNSQLYRAPEWKDCDWDNSIVVFGDSMVYGVGVDDSETITHYISQQTNTPVINLGQTGTGLDFFLANTIILKEHKIKPKAVVYCWPDRVRQTEFLSDSKILSYGPWNLDTSWMRALAIRNKHTFHRSKFMIRNMRLLWDCPIVEASWYEEMSMLTHSDNLPFLDTARDGTHPGPKTLELSASIISQRLPK
jgi:hypothetical protein